MEVLRGALGVSLTRGATFRRLRKEHEITFPWRYNDILHEANVDYDAHLRASHLNNRAPGLAGHLLRATAVFAPVHRYMLRKRGTAVGQFHCGQDYFPNEFLDGVQAAVQPVFKAISTTSSNLAPLRNSSILDTVLKTLFAKAYTKLGLLDPNVIYGFEVKARNANSPRLVTGVHAVNEMTMRRILDRIANLSDKSTRDAKNSHENSDGEENKITLMANMYSDIANTLDQAEACMEMDVTVRADLGVRLYKQRKTSNVQETLYTEESKDREIALRLVSGKLLGGFNPMRPDSERQETQVKKLKWRVSDLDHMVLRTRIKKLLSEQEKQEQQQQQFSSSSSHFDYDNDYDNDEIDDQAEEKKDNNEVKSTANSKTKKP